MYIYIYIYIYVNIYICIYVCQIHLFLFIQGYASINLPNFELNVGIFGVENVSFWNNDTLWFPSLQILLLLVPLPAIYMGYMKSKDDSEDIMFILALLSILSVVGSGMYMYMHMGVWICM
jgi:hypothetical protein